MTNEIETAIATARRDLLTADRGITDETPILGFQPVEDITLTSDKDQQWLFLTPDGKMWVGLLADLAGVRCFSSPDIRNTWIQVPPEMKAMPAKNVLQAFTPAPANKHVHPRLTMLIKYECDMDCVPGWGYQYQDWQRLATEYFDRQSHYKTKATLVGVAIK